MSAIPRTWPRLVGMAAVVLGFVAMSTCLAAAEPTAPQLMRREHEGRAVWTAFPGFACDIVAVQDNRASRGRLMVTAKGELKLDLDSSGGAEWIERTLRSVVNHRAASSDPMTNVEFADSHAAHPLGRLIRSTDAVAHSLWRVKGDVLTEVHRITEKTHMVISVTEVTRNAEGKHLPHSYNVTTCNKATGAIESNRQVLNEWQRVGDYDLPTRLLAASSKGDGSRVVEEIVLSNHRLAEAQMKVSELAPLDAPVTSFGAAVTDGHLYVFGGQLGSSHEYSSETQAHKLLRLNLAKPGKWETVADGPRRTGLAMVAHGGSVYRIGGWEAKNAGGDQWNLHSSRDFSRFDVKSGQWMCLAKDSGGANSLWCQGLSNAGAKRDYCRGNREP